MLAQVMAPTQKTELEKDLPYMRYELIGAADAKGSVGATINGGGFGDTPWGQPFLKTAQGFAKPALTVWLIQESLKVAHVRRFDDGGVLSVSVDQQPLGPPRIASGHENGDVRLWSHEAQPLLKVRMAPGGIQGPPGIGAVGFLALQGNALAALASNCYGAVLRVWDLTKIEVCPAEVHILAPAHYHSRTINGACLELAWKKLTKLTKLEKKAIDVTVSCPLVPSHVAAAAVSGPPTH